MATRHAGDDRPSLACNLRITRVIVVRLSSDVDSVRQGHRDLQAVEMERVEQKDQKIRKHEDGSEPVTKMSTVSASLLVRAASAPRRTSDCVVSGRERGRTRWNVHVPEPAARKRSRPALSALVQVHVLVSVRLGVRRARARVRSSVGVHVYVFVSGSPGAQPARAAGNVHACAPACWTFETPCRALAGAASASTFHDS